MAWQAYVDMSLVGSGHLIHKAAIFDDSGNSVWATSAGFTVSPADMQEVVAAYTCSEASGPDLHIAGERFRVFVTDDKRIYAKNDKEKKGVIIHKTNTAIILAHWQKNGCVEASEAVMKLVDYLISMGY